MGISAVFLSLSSLFNLFPSSFQTFDEKFHNVSQSFELMMDAGLARPKARPEGEGVNSGMAM